MADPVAADEIAGFRLTTDYDNLKMRQCYRNAGSKHQNPKVALPPLIKAEGGLSAGQDNRTIIPGASSVNPGEP